MEISDAELDHLENLKEKGDLKIRKTGRGPGNDFRFSHTSKAAPNDRLAFPYILTVPFLFKYAIFVLKARE